MSNFIKIHLKDGIVDKAQGTALCLTYNEDGEGYFNKNHVVSFDIDEQSCSINITFTPVIDIYIMYAALVFPDKGGEFQRIKRELTE